jgi:prepilin-type N-terminal cleavage/methylation domain-containing protein
MKKTQAFTIIELLVSVAIIAILTAVSILGLQGVRKTGQDTKRLSDIREVQVALETYKSVHGTYPEDITWLVPGFLSTVPVDPTGDAANYIYSVQYDGKSYCFTVTGVFSSKKQTDLSNGQPDGIWKTCRGNE